MHCIKFQQVLLILVLGFSISITSCKKGVLSTEKITGPETTPIEKAAQLDSIDIMCNVLMKKYHVPGVSISLISKNKLKETRTYGHLKKEEDHSVNTETMFSTGSISKVINAIVILKLVQEGKLNLDQDVNTYLKDWQIPKGRFNAKTPVTLRHILSHTAGTSVHGFADYYPGEAIPTTLQILNGEAPAKSKKVELIHEVGSKFKYSGGGITISQKIVEDLTGMSYDDAAKKILFDVLALKRTTFQNPLNPEVGNIAKAHNQWGNPMAEPIGYQSMPEKAASGLWTTPSELSKILIALLNSQNIDDGLLRPALLSDMISSENNSKFGLGPQIGSVGKIKIVEHGGSNDSYRAQFRIYWEIKAGYVVFTNAKNGTKLIKDMSPYLDKFLIENR